MTLDSPDPSPVLVLWDIDHTLIDTGGLSFELYQRGFRAATGQELRPVELASGRTDLDVGYETLRANEIEPTARMLAALASALVETYEKATDELVERGRVLPGAVAAVERLSREPQIQQGVLTGNLRRIARAKLAAYGLDTMLDLDASAYGDDHLVRADLVPAARLVATERYGLSYEGAGTVLVGDTPNDVAAAKTAGARIIAVATGRTSASDLHAAGAEHVLADLTDTERIVQLVSA